MIRHFASRLRLLSSLVSVMDLNICIYILAPLMCGTDVLIQQYFIPELMAQQPPRRGGHENVPVTILRDPYFDNKDRQPPRSRSVDPKAFLRKGSSLKKLANVTEEYGQGRESNEAERQPSDNSEIPPKSSTTNITHVNKFFLNSLANLGSKKETFQRIKRYNAEILKNHQRPQKFQILTGSSQMTSQHLSEEQSERQQASRRAKDTKERRLNGQALPPIQHQKINRDLTQLDLQIKKCEDAKKKIQDELDKVKQDLEQFKLEYGQSKKVYLRAVKQKDPNVEIWKETNDRNYKTFENCSLRITQLESRLDRLDQQILSKQTKRKQLQQEQQRQWPKTRPERHTEIKRETKSRIKLQKQSWKKSDKKPEMCRDIKPDNKFITKIKKKPEKSAPEQEARTKITQEEFREIEQLRIKKQVQGLCRQQMKLKAQLADLQAESQKADANKLPGIGKKGLEDLMEEKESQLYELRQRIEALEGKLQEI